MPINLTREQWLNESASLILDDIIPSTQAEGLPVPDYRISVAPLKASALAECHNKASSSNGHNEIFVAAHSEDSLSLLGALCHELIHAYDDCKSGHRNFFARTARRIGLEGKLTHTVAGLELAATLQSYIDLLGPIPHDKMNLKPKSKGRNNNKIKCDACGFQANLSAKWAELVHTGAECPCCESHTLQVIKA